MNSSKLGRVTREAFVRLVVALCMAGIAVAVMGGSRWFVLERMIGVLFIVDLYGTVALLWLALVSHRVGRRIGDGEHAALFGTTSGILLFQQLMGGSKSQALAVFAATMLPAVIPRSRARVVAAASVAALLGYALAPWNEYGTSDSIWGLLFAALFVAPFFAVSWWLAVRDASKEPWRLSGVTLVLVALAFLELLRLPTSLGTLGEFIEIHWSGN